MSSWFSLARLVRTTMSRSVLDWRCPPAEVEHRFEHAVGLGAHGVEAVMGSVEELLFFLKLGIYGHVVPSIRWTEVLRRLNCRTIKSTDIARCDAAGPEVPPARALVPPRPACDDRVLHRAMVRDGEPC